MLIEISRFYGFWLTHYVPRVSSCSLARDSGGERVRFGCYKEGVEAVRGKLSHMMHGLCYCLAWVTFDRGGLFRIAQSLQPVKTPSKVNDDFSCQMCLNAWRATAFPSSPAAWPVQRHLHIGSIGMLQNKRAVYLWTAACRKTSTDAVCVNSIWKIAFWPHVSFCRSCWSGKCFSCFLCVFKLMTQEYKLLKLIIGILASVRIFFSRQSCQIKKIRGNLMIVMLIIN